MEMVGPDVEAVFAALDEVDAAWDKLASLPVHALSPGQTLEVLERLEIHRRRQPAPEHALLAHLQAQSTAKEMGAKSWRAVLSQRLGISGADAGRRLGEAADLGRRRAVSGAPLEPDLPGTAAAQARGEIGTEHVSVIRDFMNHLPAAVDPGTRAAAEGQLSGLAGGLTPEGLRAVARQLMGYLDQDGTLDDEREHSRKRGITIGRQGLDGMSKISGWLTPELRATLDAVFAKLAAPGFCNPDDDAPCVAGVPSHDQITADTRSAAQRTHDALQHLGAAMLASKQLGRHHGLPVTVIATMTVAELTAATGCATTAGGTRIPIRTLIRIAGRHSHPYLLLFDKHRKIRLYYGRSRRIASAGQWLALIGTDRGCTKPGCTTCAYHCQIHHAIRDWQHGGRTDIDQLTLACGPDNRLVDDSATGWTTRKRPGDNRTEWLPPPHLDRGQHRVNRYHHPEEVLRPDQDE